MIRLPFVLSVLLFSAPILLAGCSSNGQPILPRANENVVRIVSSLPTKGAAAGQVKEIRDAISRAIAERGSIAGQWRVEYVPMEGGSEETGEWTPEHELANATAAAGDPSVVAYIGPYTTGAAAVSLPVTSKAGLMEASPSATWPGLSLPGWGDDEPARYFASSTPNFVRLMPPDSAQAEAAAQWAGTESNHTIVVLDDGSTYSAGMANSFTEAARSNFDNISKLRVHVPDVEDLVDHVSPGEAVFYAPSSVKNAVAVAKALDGKVRSVFSTDTALDSQFIEQAGNAGKNWHILSNSVPADALGKYLPPYGSSTGEEFSSQFAANAYSLTNLVLDGIASGTGRDRAALFDFVRRRQAPGNTGPIFTSSGDPAIWKVSGYQVDGDKFVLRDTFEDQATR